MFIIAATIADFTGHHRHRQREIKKPGARLLEFEQRTVSSSASASATPARWSDRRDPATWPSGQADPRNRSTSVLANDLYRYSMSFKQHEQDRDFFARRST